MCSVGDIPSSPELRPQLNPSAQFVFGVHVIPPWIHAWYPRCAGRKRSLAARRRVSDDIQLKAMILFGSYARGNAHPPDSDIDVMIVLKGKFDQWMTEKHSSKFLAACAWKTMS
jgi:hypothetical protein